MNWAHIHLMLNHVPVIGTAFGFVLFAWGAWRRNESLQRAALVTFIVVAFAAIPVYLTGEPSEDIVERLAGTAESAVEAHEDAALGALITVELVGVIALAALVLMRLHRAPQVLMRVALIGSVVAAGWMAWTANLGGKIRHSEIRGPGAQQEDDHRGRGEREERGEGR